MRHRVADLDGPVHYLDFGGPGAPLLMVHGLAGSAINWMAVGPLIASTHRAFAIDLAGFGQTPLFDRSATVGANATLVHRFIAEVIGEPVWLMGNSMGGHIGVLEAAAHPTSVRALILIDPAIPPDHVRRPEPAVLRVMAALSIPGVAATLLERHSRDVGAEGLVREALELVCADPSRVPSELVDAHVSLTRERAHLGRQNGRALLQASRSIGLRMADPRFWARVARINAPTLLLHGAQDQLIPVAAARRLARRRPDWRFVELEGVGHVPMMETPALVMEALEGWAAFRSTATRATVAAG